MECSGFRGRLGAERGARRGVCPREAWGPRAVERWASRGVTTPLVRWPWSARGKARRLSEELSEELPGGHEGFSGTPLWKIKEQLGAEKAERGRSRCLA